MGLGVAPQFFLKWRPRRKNNELGKKEENKGLEENKNY
jgi:hypothetical protein